VDCVEEQSATPGLKYNNGVPGLQESMPRPCGDKRRFVDSVLAVSVQSRSLSEDGGGVAMSAQSGLLLRPLAVMMNRSIRTIRPDATLIEAAILMRNARVGAALVMSEGTYVGVVSEADLVRKAMACGKDPAQTSVCVVMSHPLITIEIDRSAHEASDLMAEHGIRHLPVTQDGQIVGMLSVRDLLRYFKNWGTI
jgi:CBS domain-containing protein